VNMPGSAPTSASPGQRTIRPIVVAFVLFVIAYVLWSDPWPFLSPVPAATVVPAWATDVSPIRQPLFEPKIQLAAFTYQCGHCHDLFPSPLETTRTLTQHREITLKHGINTRCLNCHHLTNRETFVDDSGNEIPYDEPQLLCARCHGPVYRDWLHGSHGRTEGYWDTSGGPQQRRKCIECHDPHQPPFPPMLPAPPPTTLRMGDQRAPAGHGEADVNPLRIYRRIGTAEADGDLTPVGVAEDRSSREAH